MVTYVSVNVGAFLERGIFKALRGSTVHETGAAPAKHA